MTWIACCWSIPSCAICIEVDAELQAGLPFLEIDVVDQDNFDFLVETFFTTDRDCVPKGMIEVIL